MLVIKPLPSVPNPFFLAAIKSYDVGPIINPYLVANKTLYRTKYDTVLIAFFSLQISIHPVPFLSFSPAATDQNLSPEPPTKMAAQNLLGLTSSILNSNSQTPLSQNSIFGFTTHQTLRNYSCLASNNLYFNSTQFRPSIVPKLRPTSATVAFSLPTTTSVSLLVNCFFNFICFLMDLNFKS